MKSRIWVAIWEDGNGKVHIFEQRIDEGGDNVGDVELCIRFHAKSKGGSLLAFYRKCDVIERKRLEDYPYKTERLNAEWP